MSQISALIPEQTVLDDYVPREINGVVDLDLFAYARTVGRNVVLFGPTGSGKTMAIEAYAAKTGKPLVTVSCDEQTDPDLLLGDWVDVGKWQDGPVTQAVRNGWTLYLDEANFLHPRVSGALHSLFDSRRTLYLHRHGGEVIKAHPDFQVIIAYNPRYGGTRILNEAFKNRFALRLRWDYVRGIEEKLVTVLRTILEIADSLREMEADGEIDTPTPTNALMEFEEFAIDLGLDFAIQNFVNRYEDPDTQEALLNQFTLYRDRLEAELEAFNAGYPEGGE